MCASVKNLVLVAMMSTIVFCSIVAARGFSALPSSGDNIANVPTFVVNQNRNPYGGGGDNINNVPTFVVDQNRNPYGGGGDNINNVPTFVVDQKDLPDAQEAPSQNGFPSQSGFPPFPAFPGFQPQGSFPSQDSFPSQGGYPSSNDNEAPAQDAALVDRSLNCLSAVIGVSCNKVPIASNNGNERTNVNNYPKGGHENTGHGGYHGKW